MCKCYKQLIGMFVLVLCRVWTVKICAYGMRFLFPLLLRKNAAHMVQAEDGEAFLHTVPSESSNLEGLPGAEMGQAKKDQGENIALLENCRTWASQCFKIKETI